MDKQIKLTPELAANITWQYDGAPNLNGLVSKKSDWYATNWGNFWNNWHASVFDLKTANRFGCVVWAIILNVPVGLVYNPRGVGDTPPFGFGGGRENFNNSNFFGANPVVTLTLEEARKLLRVRYYAQTMSTTISNINGMLKDVFGEDGLSYIEETVGGTAVPPFGFGEFRQNFNAPSSFNASALYGSVKAMVQKYVFTFPLSPNFKAALQIYLPKGSGVQTIISSPDA